MELKTYTELSEYDSALSTPINSKPFLSELERDETELADSLFIVNSEPCNDTGQKGGAANGRTQSQRYNRVVKWGGQSQEFICQNCKAQQKSKIEYKVGSLNWVMMAACGLCLCMCICWLCLPCAIIPLFMDSFKDLNHICPTCGYVNGTKKQLN